MEDGYILKTEKKHYLNLNITTGSMIEDIVLPVIAEQPRKNAKESDLHLDKEMFLEISHGNIKVLGMALRTKKVKMKGVSLIWQKQVIWRLRID